MKKYEQKVNDFNEASGSSYIPEVRFLRFRKTSKGIKVGFSIGKSHEIAQLRADVARAGAPYYCKF